MGGEYCNSTHFTLFIGKMEAFQELSLNLCQKNWFSRFKEADTSLEDKLRSGRPSIVKRIRHCLKS